MCRCDHKNWSDKIIFTYKYVAGKHRRRIHILKQETEDIDPVDIFKIVTTKLRLPFELEPFYLNCFNLSDQNITIFEFLAQNEEEFECFNTFVAWLFPKLIFVHLEKINSFVCLYLTC